MVLSVDKLSHKASDSTPLMTETSVDELQQATDESNVAASMSDVVAATEPAVNDETAAAPIVETVDVQPSKLRQAFAGLRYSVEQALHGVEVAVEAAEKNPGVQELERQAESAIQQATNLLAPLIEKTSAAATQMSHTASNVAHQVSHTAQQVSQTAQNVGQQVSHQAEPYIQKAVAVAQQAAHTVEPYVQQAAQTVEPYIHQAAQAVDPYVQQAAQMSKDVVEKAKETLQSSGWM